MGTVIGYGGMAVALIAAIGGRILLAAASGYVREAHPASFEALGQRTGMFGGMLSSADQRARREIARKLLVGGLPQTVEADPKIAQIRRQWRMTVAAMVGGLLLGFAAIF